MSSKINATERMLNLVIALLGTTRGRSRAFIRQNVNGYTRQAPTRAEEATAGPAFERMFERDKEILRQVGVPITTTTNFDDEFTEQTLYRIRPEDYRVPEVRLDEPAMMVLAVAANLWTGAAFSDAAQSALRKVASRAGLGWDEDTSVQSRVRTADPAFEPLWTALRGSHPVAFSYRLAQGGGPALRHVQPWGLGGKYGQWYLHGFDTDKGAARTFRLSRITSDVEVDADTAFTRPEGFFISAVLDGLGTEEPQTASVRVALGAAHELRNRPGATVAHRAGGRDGAGHGGPEALTEELALSYRDPELMAEDLAALGAQAIVSEPAQLRAAVVDRLAAAAAACPAPGEAGPALGAKLPGHRPRRPDARDRLVRLLSMVPYLVANPGVGEDELRAEFGLTAKELEADLGTLMVSGLPGYQHGDLMDVTSEHGKVFIRDAETLASPLRLTQEEACALLVGLQALRTAPGAVPQDALATATAEVRKVAGADAWLADAVALQLVAGTELETIRALQSAISGRRAMRVSYVVRSRDEVTERTIEPLQVFSVDATWYVRAWCRNAGGFRSFRLDQLQVLADAGPRLHEPAVDAGTQVGESGAGLHDPGHVYAPSGSDTAVDLVADHLTARRLAPAYNAVVHELAGDAAEDSVGLRIMVGDLGTLPPLMARLGGRAHVAAPAEAADDVRAWLDAALTAYGAGGAGVSGNGVPGPGADHAVGESPASTPCPDR